VIVAANAPGPGAVPARPPESLLVAAIDVEWSKNYRIRGGNVPFCYSVLWLAIRRDGGSITADSARFWYTSAYVADASETPDLVVHADAALAEVAAYADLIAGHQLSSDLAVLAASAHGSLPGVAGMRAAWHQRRHVVAGRPRILDTRYDASHLLAGASRRLVDVCAELQLDVTQPELRGVSMTALHRRWLEDRVVGAREKITVLNLRHALSTALVAIRAAEFGCWDPGLNVNQMLAAGLEGRFGWLDGPVFAALLAGPDGA
jgi:hypothetical protein